MITVKTIRETGAYLVVFTFTHSSSRICTPCV
jgi:hypothetical protein